jgi:hypothetical protein
MNNIWKGNNIRLRAVEMSDLEEYFCNDNHIIDTDAQRTGDRSMFPLSKALMREEFEIKHPDFSCHQV